MAAPEEHGSAQGEDSHSNPTHGRQEHERDHREDQPDNACWFKNFKHSHWNVFCTVESWVRLRLRRILRKNEGQRGKGRGNDQIKWTNAYFERPGFYSLEKAHA
jgi:hypothetical protein